MLFVLYTDIHEFSKFFTVLIYEDQAHHFKMNAEFNVVKQEQGLHLYLGFGSLVYQLCVKNATSLSNFALKIIAI